MTAERDDRGTVGESGQEAAHAVTIALDVAGDGWARHAPSDSLYWALLDPKSLGRERLRDHEIPNLLESWLPLPIDEVAVASARLNDGRVVACAVERRRLDASDRAGWRSLTPSKLPEELPADVREAIAPSAFELLTGAYAPPDLERARRGWRVAVAAAVILVATLGIVGVLRRGLALDRSIADADRRRLALVEAAFAGRPGPPGVPAEMRLVAELRELRGTRSGDVPIPFDATDALAALVKVWPEGVDLRPESIAVSERGISVRGEAKGHTETQILADALASLEGWRVEAPASRSVKDGVSFTVTLSRDASVRRTAAGAIP